ncbi:hypothetical protein [Chitiniphilus eburneus]|uniref:hypothetical protein n=1 Tax=Chitiniphilus eburneus TaxID=2571148 RepID=UPI0035CEA08D
MALKLNTHLRQFLACDGSLQQALRGGEIRIYGSSRPANADLAPGAAPLAVITAAGAVRVAEVCPTGTLTLGGSAGSLTSVTHDGKEVLGATVEFAGDLATTAGLVAQQINASQAVPVVYATASGPAITLHAMPGVGATGNAKVVAATAGGGLTATTANMAGGVNAANGLLYGAATAGALPKLATQVWSGTALAGGTAVWARAVGAVADDDTANPTHPRIFRIDGSFGVGSGDFQGATTTVVNGAPQTIVGGSFVMGGA